jgi:hypothetical protein
MHTRHYRLVQFGPIGVLPLVKKGDFIFCPTLPVVFTIYPLLLWALFFATVYFANC